MCDDARASGPMSVSFHQPPSRRRTRVTQLTRPAPTSDDVSDFRTHGRTPNELSQCQPVLPHPAIVPRPMEAPPMGSKLNAAQLGLERNWAARSDRTVALGGDGTAGGLGTTTYGGPEMVGPTYHGHDDACACPLPAPPTGPNPCALARSSRAVFQVPSTARQDPRRDPRKRSRRLNNGDGQGQPACTVAPCQCTESRKEDAVAAFDANATVFVCVRVCADCRRAVQKNGKRLY